MSDEDVERLMARPEIAAIEAEKFPSHIPLRGILRNDARLMRYKAGDIIVREGDYGNSAFLILGGFVRVVLSPGLSRAIEGRSVIRKKNLWQSLSQIWKSSPFPEVRDMRNYQSKQSLRAGQKESEKTRVFIQDIPAVLDSQKTARLGTGELFGELAALGRIPRTATVFAEDDTTVLLEIRWQGLRELSKYDPGWKRMVDERYRENALKTHLSESTCFSKLNQETIQSIAGKTLFETYGTFDWHLSYQKYRKQGQGLAEHEPMISKQGDYPDGALLIRAGFARVCMTFGTGERTLTYLGKGDIFGLDEIYEAWKEKKEVSLQTSLRAVGYVDVLRVPTEILERHVFPGMAPPRRKLIDFSRHSIAQDSLLEWAVDERFINATQAMVIDLEKCTRCDDCVRACASTHEGNPRFIRHGKIIDHWMVANACMHCVDPVCMIGCPTGAIHRTETGGSVVINDNTCIGCGVCSNSCPYDNIRMVEIRDLKGKPVVDPKGQIPIMKATKCDLCSTQLGGPACVRACPHDAVRRTDILSFLS